ncbi:MAG: SapC family protein [Sphingomonadales bacterium]|nr:SapC family protein [Sphingomonadales bacterium]
MATQPVQQGLPLFYKGLVPLNSSRHAITRARSVDNTNFMQRAACHPLTVEELFRPRHFPIIFSASDNPVPLALMGMKRRERFRG